SAFENGGSRAFDIGALAEIADADYDALAPVQWPLPAGAAKPQRLFADGRFFTPDGKARFVPTEPRAPKHLPTADLPLVLNTGRIRDQWHTMTRTGKSPRLTGHHAEPFVQIHSADARRCGVAGGDLAEVSTEDERVLARVEVTDDVRPGTI